MKTQKIIYLAIASDGVYPAWQHWNGLFTRQDLKHMNVSLHMYVSIPALFRDGNGGRGPCWRMFLANFHISSHGRMEKGNLDFIIVSRNEGHTLASCAKTFAEIEEQGMNANIHSIQPMCLS